MNQGPFQAHASPLVRADWLRAHLAEVRVLDVRWYLSGKRGVDEYAKGHVPGAVFVDLDRDLASPKGQGPGRHPLPTARSFAGVLSRLGLTPTTRVVVYDDAAGSIAARVWWLLRHFGLPTAAVLDGGLAAWTAEGGSLSSEVPVIVPAPTMHLVARTDDVVDKHAVDRLRTSKDALIYDVRATERYEGKVEPIDARAGHIPGARSLPFAGNLQSPGGLFLDRDSLSARYAAAGLTPDKQVVCSCGSGVTACHSLLALAMTGREDALLYEGSWSDWAADPSLPVAVGPDVG